MRALQLLALGIVALVLIPLLAWVGDLDAYNRNRQVPPAKPKD